MRRPRLLVVDDDPDIVRFLEVVLQDRVLEIETVGTGEEALDQVADEPPAAILLDLRLPGMNGLETLRALKQAGTEAPVVLITSHASMDATIQAMREGAYDFLTKPLRSDAVTAIVDRVLRAEPLDVGAVGDEPGEEEAETRIIGSSPAMVEVFKRIGRVTRTNTTVLITGESGTGKELIAHVLHRTSHRRQRPFLVVNCAAIPETLLESELFGHEKGSFTGAVERRIGKFERADAGTLFLDENGDMPLGLQSKILRALEGRSIERVGSRAAIPVDVRFVAATHHDLQAAVEAGRFREDLYYRLAVFTLRLPPLRERREDIRALADHFLRCFQRDRGRPLTGASAEVYRRLEAYGWPGNVRELRNVLQRAMILSPGPTLRPSDLPALAAPPETGVEDPIRALRRAGLSLADVEREYYRAALEETGWNLTRAAAALDVHRNTVRRKIAELGLGEPDTSSS
ncbi:MAG: sigma-54-dependent transcriptional regulator, partial [Gemmatimonadota bacterium]